MMKDLRSSHSEIAVEKRFFARQSEADSATLSLYICFYTFVRVVVFVRMCIVIASFKV